MPRTYLHNSRRILRRIWYNVRFILAWSPATLTLTLLLLFSRRILLRSAFASYRRGGSRHIAYLAKWDPMGEDIRFNRGNFDAIAALQAACSGKRAMALEDALYSG